MNVHDWSLIIFTILAQMAVGAFVVLGGVHFFAVRRSGVAEADKLSDRALLAIGPVLVLGLIATFFHLGNPLNAPLAFSNLGSSWLSREIALVMTFTILGAVFAFMQWRKVSTPQIRSTLGLVTAGVGLVLVYVMARIYMLPTVPAWDSWATPVSFYVTTFLLGSLALGVALTVNYIFMQRQQGAEIEKQKEMVAITLRWTALISIVMLGVQFIVIPLYLSQLATGGTAAVASASILVDDNGLLLAMRLVLVFLGAGVFGLFLYQSAVTKSRIQLLANLAYAAFALVLVAEVIGRYLFYSSFVRVGI